MGWILDVVLVLFILLGIFLGMRRGFFGSLAKMLGGVLRLVISILLAKPVVKLVSLTNIDEHLFDKIHLKVSALSDKFNVNIVGMSAEELKSFSSNAIADADIPKLFRSFFLNIFNISPEAIAARESVTIADMMSITIVNAILLVVSFVVLFVFLWLIVKLLMLWSRKHVKQKTIFAKTNKWLGGLFGLIKSLLIVFVCFVVVSLFSGFGFMQSVVNFIDSTILSKLLYKLSLLLINSSFDLKAMLQSWL